MEEKTKQKIIRVSAGTLVVLALAGFFWLGSSYGKKNCLPAFQNLENKKMPVRESGDVAIEQAVPDKKTTDDKTPNVSGENSEDARSDTATGWKTFTNKFQKYEFSYPESGQVAQAWTSGHEADVDPTDGACVSLKLNGGYLAIVGKTHTDEQAAMCLGTGLGTEWGPAEKIELEVFGEKYSVSGMKTSSASAGYRKEYYVVNTDSGERIKAGIEVNEKYAPELTYEEAKAEVLAVLKTFKKI